MKTMGTLIVLCFVMGVGACGGDEAWDEALMDVDSMEQAMVQPPAQKIPDGIENDPALKSMMDRLAAASRDLDGYDTPKCEGSEHRDITIGDTTIHIAVTCTAWCFQETGYIDGIKYVEFSYGYSHQGRVMSIEYSGTSPAQ